MPIESLQDVAVKALDDLQAIDTTVLDVRDLTSITDTMIVCTGRSSRHLKSIADNLLEEGQKLHLSQLHVEGGEDHEWVLVDMGDVVVHIMLPNTRTLYNLEALWTPIVDLQVNQQGA